MTNQQSSTSRLNDVAPSEWDEERRELDRISGFKDRKFTPLCPTSPYCVDDLYDGMVLPPNSIILSNKDFDNFTDACDIVSNRDKQISGDHYKNSKHQPLEIVLDTEGFEAFRGACLVKIYKYLQRHKDDRLEDYKKAQHILDWLVEETERRGE